MSMQYQVALMFGVIGIVATWGGWSAWSGRHRSWVRLGRGYRILAMLPFGIGCLLFSIAVLVPVGIGVVLFALGGLCCLLGFLYGLATLFVKDRWYPRWYHQLPPDQREW